jgi:hypothetical protein
MDRPARRTASLARDPAWATHRRFWNVMPPQKPDNRFPKGAPADRSSAAFVSYVYSHSRRAPLPEVPREPAKPRKGKAASQG